MPKRKKVTKPRPVQQEVIRLHHPDRGAYGPAFESADDAAAFLKWFDAGDHPAEPHELSATTIDVVVNLWKSKHEEAEIQRMTNAKSA